MVRHDVSGADIDGGHPARRVHPGRAIPVEHGGTSGAHVGRGHGEPEELAFADVLREAAVVDLALDDPPHRGRVEQPGPLAPPEQHPYRPLPFDNV